MEARATADVPVEGDHETSRAGETDSVVASQPVDGVGQGCTVEKIAQGRAVDGRHYACSHSDIRQVTRSAIYI